MRMIAGEWRGRKLVAPAGQQTRPTADRKIPIEVFDRSLTAGEGAIEHDGRGYVTDDSQVLLHISDQVFANDRDFDDLLLSIDFGT